MYVKLMQINLLRVVVNPPPPPLPNQKKKQTYISKMKTEPTGAVCENINIIKQEGMIQGILPL